MSLGFNSPQYKVEGTQENDVCECTEEISIDLTMYNMESDLNKIINEYCDNCFMPLLNNKSRDIWILGRVKKLKIRYFDDI